MTDYLAPVPQAPATPLCRQPNPLSRGIQSSTGDKEVSPPYTLWDYRLQTMDSGPAFGTDYDNDTTLRGAVLDITNCRMLRLGLTGPAKDYSNAQIAVTVGGTSKSTTTYSETPFQATTVAADGEGLYAHPFARPANSGFSILRDFYPYADIRVALSTGWAATAGGGAISNGTTGDAYGHYTTDATVDYAEWVDSVVYVIGDKVTFTPIPPLSPSYWQCKLGHTSNATNAPDGPLAATYWDEITLNDPKIVATQAFYVPDNDPVSDLFITTGVDNISAVELYIWFDRRIELTTAAWDDYGTLTIVDSISGARDNPWVQSTAQTHEWEFHHRLNMIKVRIKGTGGTGSDWQHWFKSGATPEQQTLSYTFAAGIVKALDGTENLEIVGATVSAALEPVRIGNQLFKYTQENNASTQFARLAPDKYISHPNVSHRAHTGTECAPIVAKFDHAFGDNGSVQVVRGHTGSPLREFPIRPFGVLAIVPGAGYEDLEGPQRTPSIGSAGYRQSPDPFSHYQIKGSSETIIANQRTGTPNHIKLQITEIDTWDIQLALPQIADGYAIRLGPPGGTLNSLTGFEVRLDDGRQLQLQQRDGVITDGSTTWTAVDSVVATECYDPCFVYRQGNPLGAIPETVPTWRDPSATSYDYQADKRAIFQVLRKSDAANANQFFGADTSDYGLSVGDWLTLVAQTDCPCFRDREGQKFAPVGNHLEDTVSVGVVPNAGNSTDETGAFWAHDKFTSGSVFVGVEFDVYFQLSIGYDAGGGPTIGDPGVYDPDDTRYSMIGNALSVSLYRKRPDLYFNTRTVADGTTVGSGTFVADAQIEVAARVDDPYQSASWWDAHSGDSPYFDVEWDFESVAYSVGDFVIGTDEQGNTAGFECIQDNNSSDWEVNQPGNGSDWESYWKLDTKVPLAYTVQITPGTTLGDTAADLRWYNKYWMQADVTETGPEDPDNPGTRFGVTTTTGTATIPPSDLPWPFSATGPEHVLKGGYWKGHEWIYSTEAEFHKDLIGGDDAGLIGGDDAGLKTAPEVPV